MQGSLINRLCEQMVPSAPKVGDGYTAFHYTDRSAGTVVEVSADGKRVTVQEDNFQVIGDYLENRYEFSPNPTAPKVVYTLRKNGRYVRDGESLKNGQVVQFGRRDKYHDPSF